jgi:FKBP-type peptidyl-prolyl cis-trans isomerase
VKSFAPILALGLALALAACGGEGSSNESGQGESDKSGATTAKSDSTEKKKTKPKVEVPKGPPPRKLVKEDLETGSGAVAKAGDKVTVQYVGVEYKNGKQIDASWDRGEPFSFSLGAGEVIPGWEEGVPGMKVGGRRQLVIPSELAYGSGALVFVIDLISIDSSAESTSTNAEHERSKPNVEVPSGPPPKDLVVKDIEEGSGAEVKADDEVVVDYVGVLYKTGKQFESTWDDGETRTFKLGHPEVIDGWKQGVPGMKVGGRRELIIPSKQAFETGAVIYVIDLLEIE